MIYFGERVVAYGTSYDVRRCGPPAGAGCTPVTLASPGSGPLTDTGAGAISHAWYIVAPRNACGATPPAPGDPPSTWPGVNPYYACEPRGPVLVKFAPAAPGNRPPAVEAGRDQTFTLPVRAALRGKVTDDCLPDPPAAVSVVWSEVSGPGAVVFADPTATDTLASLAVPGT